MFCTQCGTKLNEQTNICPNCSAPNKNAKSAANYQTQGNTQSYNANPGGYDNTSRANGFYEATSYENSVNSYAPPSYGYPDVKKPGRKGGNTLLITLLSVFLVILLMCTAVIGAYKLELFSTGGEADKTSSSEESAKEPSEPDENEPDDKETVKSTRETLSGKTITRSSAGLNLEEDLNNYISNNFYDTLDVAVCVIDNRTDKMYCSQYSRKQYVSWGFYLPIYMALDYQYPGEYELVRSKIVSSDIATCNKYSNIGIDYLGGFSGINKILMQDYNLFATTYSRKFGDTTSYADNYTTPEDAAIMLKELNDAGEYYVLKDASFQGIVAPDNKHRIYAQYGSEDKTANKNFNTFAIIKGEADLCIAIMSKNQTNAKSVVNDIYAIAVNALR